MKVVELLLNDEVQDGIDAISIVNRPAIEENFVALKEQKEVVRFKENDKEKRLLTGALLIPEKLIYRFNEKTKEEYYVFFSEDTIEKASQKYLIKGYQSKSTLEHEMDINGLTLVESWLITDKENDKSNSFGMDLPKGTWMGTVKVNNQEIWDDFVKTGKVKGFSIEGYFTNVVREDKENEKDNAEDLALLKEIVDLLNALDEEEERK